MQARQVCRDVVSLFEEIDTARIKSDKLLDTYSGLQSCLNYISLKQCEDEIFLSSLKSMGNLL